MSRKYDSKRRKKWARRILLAETIKRITLTCVRKNEDEVWMNAHDIFADWMGNPGKSRKRRRVGSRSTRYDMTTQEKNILWYSHDNIRQFGQTEIKRRKAIGIQSNSILYPQ